MTEHSITCVYCGASATDWDHLRPLVRGKRPTGYLTEHRNLVPSCGPCNQSKSGCDWKEWMLGRAKNGLRARGIPDLPEKVARLESFEKWGEVQAVDLGEMVGEALWNSYWDKLQNIEDLMHDAQRDATIIKKKIAEHLESF